jgi:site-specific recombinase XerD
MLSRRLQEFLEEKRAIWSPETEEKYRRNLTEAAKWLGAQGIREPADVTSADLQQWLEGHPSWGPSTRHVAVTALRSFFGWAVGPARSPAHLVPLPRRPLRPQRTLSIRQAAALLESIDSSRRKGIRDLALVSLLLDTGLRSSEICRLELEHVEIERRSFQALTKGRRWERGVFSRYTQAILERWLAVRSEYAASGEGAFFVSVGGLTPGKHLTRHGLQLILRTLGREAGIGPISPHDFRRTFATLALRSGAPTRIVQVAGRWRSLAMVERYTQAIQPEDLDGHFPVAALMDLVPDQ